MEWAGESSRHRVPAPPEWQSCPGGTKPPEGPQLAREDRGRTERGGEGTKPPPPPEQPGRREPTAAATTGRWAGCRRRRTAAARRTCRRIPPAPTAPGPIKERLHVASTAYWRRRGRQSTHPTRGTPVSRLAMGPQRTRTGRSRRRRGTKPFSARSLLAATTESGMRRGDPLNGRACLTRAAAKVGKEGGDPPPRSARPRRAAGERGGPPNTAARDPTTR